MHMGVGEWERGNAQITRDRAGTTEREIRCDGYGHESVVQIYYDYDGLVEREVVVQPSFVATANRILWPMKYDPGPIPKECPMEDYETWKRRQSLETLAYRAVLLASLAAAVALPCLVCSGGCRSHQPGTGGAAAQIATDKLSQANGRITTISPRQAIPNRGYDEIRWNWKRSRGTEQKLMQGAHRPQERIWAGRRH